MTILGLNVSPNQTFAGKFVELARS